MYIRKKYKNAFFIELNCNDSNVKIIITEIKFF